MSTNLALVPQAIVELDAELQISQPQCGLVIMDFFTAAKSS
jgi:hypothetical protein